MSESHKGPFRPGDRGPVGIGIAEMETDVEQRYADLVGDEGIFFLVPVGAARPEFGVSALDPPSESPGDWVLVNSQGVIIDDRGTAVFATNVVEEGFAHALSGAPFADVERQIETLADEEATP